MSERVFCFPQGPWQKPNKIYSPVFHMVYHTSEVYILNLREALEISRMQTKYMFKKMLPFKITFNPMYFNSWYLTSVMDCELMDIHNKTSLRKKEM